MSRLESGSPHTAPALYLLALLAVLYTLYFAADLLIPITFALLLNFLLTPPVRWLSRRGVPSAVSAAAIVVSIVVFLGVAISSLTGPAEEWLAEAPSSIQELRYRLGDTQERLANIKELAAEVDELTDVEDKDATRSVVIESPSLLEDAAGGLPSFLGSAGIVAFLVFFLLGWGDNLLRRVLVWARGWPEQRRMVEILRHVERDLFTYLATLTVINTVLGCVVAATLWGLGVPNFVLWGVMVGVFNFAPYVGAAVSAGVLLVVGVTAFQTLGEALVVPGAFLALTILEGQVITPAILGRRMATSPVFVFLAVIFWGWMWGVAGALLAVPLLTVAKIISSHVPAWRRFAAFLGEVEGIGAAVAAERADPPTVDPERDDAARDRRK